MSITTEQVPTTGTTVQEDGTPEQKQEKTPRKPFTYTVLASVDGGRTYSVLGEFSGLNQREARQAAVESNEPLRTAIMSGETPAQLAAVSRFTPVSAEVKNRGPELVV